MKWLRILYRLNNALGGLWTGVKSTGKIKDSIGLGLLSGLLGTLAMDLSNLILWKKGKTETLLGHLAGSMLFRSWRTNRRKDFLLGQIAHMITGSALGIPLLYVLKKTGRDLAYLKGAFYASLTWSVLVDGATRLGLYRARPKLTKTFYAALFDNLIYGLSTTYAVLHFGDLSQIPSKKPNKAAAEATEEVHVPNEYIADLTPTVNQPDPQVDEGPSYLH